MSNKNHPPRFAVPISLALFSVCADRHAVGAALDATSVLSGSVFVGEFHDYITEDKTPLFESSINDAAACIALVDFDRNPDLALKTAERLGQIFHKKVSIVAIASQLNADLLLQAMRAGCNEYLTKPIDANALGACLSRLKGGIEGSLSSPVNQGQVIALYGAKGGVGTSAIAVHLAVHVAGIPKKTLLIDQRPSLGHLALYLGLQDHQYSLDDVLRNAERLDADLLGGFVVRHSSGLEVLTSPEKPGSQKLHTPEIMHRVMAVLRREYDWILVDAPLAGEDRPPLFDLADQSYLVSTTDIASLRDLGRRLHRMSLNESDRTKTKLILNRVTPEDAAGPEQIGKTIGLPIAAALPNAYAELLRALNRGEPLQPGGKLRFTKEIAALARQLTAANTERMQAGKKSFAFWSKKARRTNHA